MPEPYRTDDEVVSAVLDGEATAAERARVAADPELSARLAEFAAVADALGSPVAPASAQARDAAIAAAMGGRGRPEAEVVRMRSRRSTGSFLAVAAAVLVVLVFAGFLVGQVGDRNGTEDSAGRARDDSAAEDAGVPDASTAGGAAAEPDDTATAVDDSGPIDLGTVADEDALRAALVASGGLDTFGAGPTTRPSLPEAALPEGTEAVPGDGEACLVRLGESDPARDGVLLEGTATYAGTAAIVYVFATVDGDTRVEVVTAAACERLVAFPL